MARVFIDGFESGSHDLWTITAGTPTIADNITGMSGNYCLNLATGVSTTIYKDVPNSTEYYFAFKFRHINHYLTSNFFSLGNGFTELATLSLDNVTRSMIARKGSSSGTVLGTGINSFVGDVFHLVEVRFKSSSTAGFFQVKVNGVTEIDFSGNTNDSSANINRLFLHNIAYFDDFIVDNSGWIGNTSVQGLTVSGAGTHTGFTPSAGDNYECIDEIPYNDNDFIYATSPNVIDTYTITALPVSPRSIKAVQLQARCSMEGNPAFQNVKLVCRSGGTDYVSSANQVASLSKSYTGLWELNPADSSAWTKSAVDAIEIGIKTES